MQAYKIAGDGYQCLGEFENRWKTENSNSVVLPEGYSITEVVVKTSTNCIRVYQNNEAAACYSVVVNGNQTTVNQKIDSSACQGISHLEGKYEIVPTATPTPTSIPTPTPTAIPSSIPTPTLAQEVTPIPTEVTVVTQVPELVPTSQPQANDSNSGYHSALSTDELSCDDENFYAVFDLKKDGQVGKDIKVRFTFNGQVKEITTDSSGRAKIDFKIAVGTLTAKAEHYPEQSLVITEPICPLLVAQENITSNLAATGQQDDILAGTLASVALLLSAYAAYAYKKLL